MNRLEVVQNEVTYKAAFSSPLFQVWASGGAIFVYKALSPFGISLSSIRSEELSRSPADQSIIVESGNWTYRWKFERVELTLRSFSDEELQSLPKLLHANDTWMRSMGIPVEYASQQFSYLGHLKIEQLTSQQVLDRIPHFCLGEGQEFRAAGQILHWSESSQSWQGDLVVDHSQLVADGLFILYSGTSRTATVDYERLVSYLQERLDVLLAGFGLRMEGREPRHNLSALVRCLGGRPPFRLFSLRATASNRSRFNSGVPCNAQSSRIRVSD